MYVIFRAQFFSWIFVIIFILDYFVKPKTHQLKTGEACVQIKIDLLSENEAK